MAYEGKLYKHNRDEKFEELIDSLGLPADAVTGFKNYKPDQKLEKNGDTFTLTTISPNDTNTLTFKLDEEFVETVFPGLTAKTTYTLNGNTLTKVQKFDDGGVFTTKREYFDDKLIATLTVSKWDGVAVRHYKV